MEHRIREAMREGGLAPRAGSGPIVEVDETFIGRKDGYEAKQGMLVVVDGATPALRVLLKGPVPHDEAAAHQRMNRQGGRLLAAPR
jgi:hypothetical protein